MYSLKSFYFSDNFIIMDITFAVIKERKSPPDKRVVLTPNSCLSLLKSFSSAKVLIESSDIRSFSDNDYRLI